MATEPAVDDDVPTRPIIPGFYPDPTICRVGHEYYLANSSFEYFPGVPLFRSDDLIEWRQLGNVLDRRSQFPLVERGASRGVYAPTLRHHDGRFWLVTTNVSDVSSGQLLVTAVDPAGPWSEPVRIPEAVGIDPDICWDADGVCYLTWKAMDLLAGTEDGIRQAPLDVESGRLIEPDYPLWQGTGMVAPEGPHLYQIDGTWYLLLAEGGTERGHSVTVARAPSPRGPFEPCPWNPILTHRSSGHPVQNVGHADLVQTPEGDWAAVFLGTRPSGSTPGFHTIGRETFLAGVDWIDGWPVLDVDRYSPVAADTSFVDDFAGSTLDSRWVTPDGEPAACSRVLPGRAGRELAVRDGGPALCVRVRDLTWVATATFEEGGVFQVRIDERHWYGVRAHAGEVSAEARIGDVHQVFASLPWPDGPQTLRIASEPSAARPMPLGHGGPDDIVLSFIDPAGETVELMRLDGRYVSTEVAGGFTGRMLGLGAAAERSQLLHVSYRSAF